MSSSHKYITSPLLIPLAFWPLLIPPIRILLRAMWRLLPPLLTPSPPILIHLQSPPILTPFHPLTPLSSPSIPPQSHHSPENSSPSPLLPGTWWPWFLHLIFLHPRFLHLICLCVLCYVLSADSIQFLLMMCCSYISSLVPPPGPGSKWRLSPHTVDFSWPLG